jgi:hypothetical protein
MLCNFLFLDNADELGNSDMDSIPLTSSLLREPMGERAPLASFRLSPTFSLPHVRTLLTCPANSHAHVDCNTCSKVTTSLVQEPKIYVRDK